MKRVPFIEFAARDKRADNENILADGAIPLSGPGPCERGASVVKRLEPIGRAVDIAASLAGSR
jgi:hypothetical protein